jgi:peptide/nickel transport system permease protein
MEVERVRRFIIRRLFMLVIVLWGVSTVAFALMHISGDPVALMIDPNAPPSAVQKLRQDLGLDAPLYVQYFRFLLGVTGGDFGNSIRQGVPAFSLVMQRVPATMELAVVSTLVAVITGVPLGIAAALKRGTLLEVGVMSSALFGQSVPAFWLGLVLILILGVYMRVLPVSGRGTLAMMVMPVITLSVNSIAKITRMLRSSMLEQMNQDYVRTARSKGLAESRVIVGHVLKNASLSVVTLVGMDFAHLLGGAVIIETVFAWPGVGNLVVNAVFQRDFPVVQAAVFAMGLVFVAINLLMDLLYVTLDPRIDFD